MTLRTPAYALIGLALLAAAACAPVQVMSYTAPGREVTRGHTYAWDRPRAEPTGDPRLDSNEIVDRHLRLVVDRALAQRGWVSASAEPHVLLRYHLSVDQLVDDPERSYESRAKASPAVHDQGTLVLDMVDPRDDRLLWRGWARRTVDDVIDDQPWLEREIEDAVGRIIATLPDRSQ